MCLSLIGECEVTPELPFNHSLIRVQVRLGDDAAHSESINLQDFSAPLKPTNTAHIGRRIFPVYDIYFNTVLRYRYISCFRLETIERAALS
jgi:hypothetical protein